MDTKPLLPPFTFDAATQKVRMAEDDWNTRDPSARSWSMRVTPFGATGFLHLDRLPWPVFFVASRFNAPAHSAVDLFQHCLIRI